MRTAATHQIRDFAFDATFASEDTLFADGPQLSSFVSERLLGVANEVFEKAAGTLSSTMQIDTLRIDLGKLPAYGYYEEAESRFRKQLEEQIADEIRRQERAVRASIEHHSEHARNNARDLDIVLYWIESGHLPWNATGMDATALHQLLEQVAVSYGAEFALRLRAAAKNGNPQRMAQRLAWNLPRHLHGKLASILRSSHASVYAGEHYAQIRAEAEWLRLLNEDSDFVGVEVAIRQRIASGEPEHAAHAWAEWLKDFPEAVDAVVRNEGRRKEVRRNMAIGLKQATLKGIVQILEPVESDLVEEVADSPESFAHAADRTTKDIAETRSSLWETILTYLLAERGTRFNRSAFLRSVIRQMAAHANTCAHCRVRWRFDTSLTTHHFCARRSARWSVRKLRANRRPRLLRHSSRCSLQGTMRPFRLRSNCGLRNSNAPYTPMIARQSISCGSIVPDSACSIYWSRSDPTRSTKTIAALCWKLFRFP